MKKKIISSLLSLSLVFNIGYVTVYAEDTLVEDSTIAQSGDDSTTTQSDDGIATIGSTVIITGGTISFPENTFADSVTSDTKVGQIKFEGKDVAKEGQIYFATTSTATFSFENNGSIDLDDDTTYKVTMLDYGDYKLSGYTIADYTPDSDVENGNVTFDAIKSAEKVTVSGSVTFVDASKDDFEDYTPKLEFTAENYETKTVELRIDDTRMGYLDGVELAKDVEYKVDLIDIEMYELADYGDGKNYNNFIATESSSNVELFATRIIEDDTDKSEITVTGIVTFPDAEFNDDSFDTTTTITFTPIRGGDTKTTTLGKGGATTANYSVDLLEEKYYRVTISGVDGYTMNERYTTLGKDDTNIKDFTATKVVEETPEVEKEESYYDYEEDDSSNNSDNTEDGFIQVVVPSAGGNGTYGDVSVKNFLVEEVAGFTPKLSAISTTDQAVNDTIINSVIEKFTSSTGGYKNEYSAPLVMFDFGLVNGAGENYSGAPVTIKIEFDPITLDAASSDANTFLQLFHFNSNNVANVVEANFSTNSKGEYTSVEFSTNDFSPFAIAQGYSTVKITQSGSSDGNTYYVTGNVPTIGFISQLRGVSVGELVNLDKITVTGKEIIGWYLDRDFTKEVEDTSEFVITQDVMDGGVYPLFKVDIDVLGVELYIEEKPVFEESSYAKPNAVPYTGVKLGARLF